MNKSTLLLATLAAGVAFSSVAFEKLQNVATLPKLENSADLMAPEQTNAYLDVNAATFSKKATVKASTATASYTAPAGVFNLGRNSAGRGYSINIRKGPAYQDLTFINTSTDATSYVWQYQDPDNISTGDSLISVAKDLTVNYGYSFINSPKLTAYADGDTEGNTYDPNSDGTDAYYYLGGPSDNAPFSSSTLELGISTFDMPYYKSDDGYTYTRGGIYSYQPTATSGFSTNGTATQWESYVKSRLSGSNAQIEGFGLVFDKPASTYCVTKFWAWLNVVATAATQLNVDIIKIDENGALTNDTIASGTADVASGSSTYLTFNLYTVDEFGFQSTDPINIDSSILVVVNGFVGNSAISTVYPCFGMGHNYLKTASTSPSSNIYNVFSYTDKNGNAAKTLVGAAYSYYIDDAQTTLMRVRDYIYQLDATFWWITSDADAYTLAAEGETKTIMLNSYYSYNTTTKPWTVEEVDGADISWLSYTFENQTEDGSFTGDIKFNVTATALPTGVTSREANLKLSYAGASKTIKITQGEGGVATTVADNNATVTVEGENFVVTAPESVTAAEVYNVAGQKVAQAAVAGTATIDASALANGLYIVKLNNGTAVKVVK